MFHLKFETATVFYFTPPEVVDAIQRGCLQFQLATLALFAAPEKLPDFGEVMPPATAISNLV